MMTNEIIEILRHHDNVCGVLERAAPRFEPFEIGVALHYAHRTFQDPRIYASIILAAFNAHHHTIRWKIDQVMTHDGVYQYEQRRWGWFNENEQCAAITAVSFYQHYYINVKYLPQEHPNALHMSIFSYEAQRPFIYPRALLLGLQDHGLQITKQEAYEPGKTENAETYYNPDEDYASCEMEALIPFENFAQCAQRLEEILLHDEIGMLPDNENAITPGPLALRVFEELDLTEDQKQRWLSPDTYYDDYGTHDEYAEDEDIPF